MSTEDGDVAVEQAISEEHNEIVNEEVEAEAVEEVPEEQYEDPGVKKLIFGSFCVVFTYVAITFYLLIVDAIRKRVSAR